MEEWRPIVGFEDYEVSNQGRVRSLYYKQKRRILNLKLVSVSVGNHGYNVVNIKQKTFTVHRLLAKAFIENPDNLECVDHINRIRTDNRLENLRWVTKLENNRNRQPGASGHLFIKQTKNHTYCVNFQNPYQSQTFKTLEEAISARDEIITSV